MGHPKKQRKKYSGPTHPWQADRLKREAILMKEYGLKNKKELWKMGSVLRSFKKQAKSLISRIDEQAKTEKNLLIQKLYKLGLLESGAKIEDVLDLDIRNILNRRLQFLALKKGLARSTKQARQFIVHEHIFVADKKIDSPSYLVKKNEEDKITFGPLSSFASLDHPERVPLDKKELSGEKQVKEKPVEVAT
ncbi:MAG: 30S ribosomal protein S4 [Nanoarchaeota archaeon]